MRSFGIFSLFLYSFTPQIYTQAQFQLLNKNLLQKYLLAQVYFVCNSPGLDDWVELPMVTPQQIVISRQIVHLFTGNLEAQVTINVKSNTKHE